MKTWDTKIMANLPKYYKAQPVKCHSNEAVTLCLLPPIIHVLSNNRKDLLANTQPFHCISQNFWIEIDPWCHPPSFKKKIIHPQNIHLSSNQWLHMKGSWCGVLQQLAVFAILTFHLRAPLFWTMPIPLFKLPPTGLNSLILGSSWQPPISIPPKTSLKQYPKTIYRVTWQAFREHEGSR